MSYDLFFRSRLPGVGFSQEDFTNYFGNRPRYELNESQAWYKHKNSGVYFVFEFNESQDNPDEEDEVDSSLIPVAFNLNYIRPHPFGLEAEIEVAAFVKAFDLTVSDPQMSGMGEGEYSEDGFLRGWNAGNEFGYRATFSRDPLQAVHTLSSARIEACWRWNFDSERRQDELGDDVFVPRILFFNQSGEVQTGAAWGDGIPILLPVVDLVLVPRHRLAPQKWFRSKDDIVVFTWAELASLTQHFRKLTGDPDAYELFYESTPPEIEQAIRQKQPPKELPKGIAFDHILNRELVEQARK